AIRLSPQAYVHLEYSKGDEKTYKKLLKKLNTRQICYVHLGAFSDHYTFDYLDGGKASEFIRKHYKGNFITCGNYSIDMAEEAVKDKKADLVAIGRAFIANPYLIQRVKSGQKLEEYDMKMLSQLD
ncbi:MAG: alkene reductase, partial [Proteobacteria bacterium]|nr:alkene reductase [Pseudomonadota bacterium]